MARRRSTRLPDAVRDRLELAAGDRVLAAGMASDGWVVATRHHLHVLTASGDRVLSRAWSDVDGARLDAQEARLTVRWVDAAPVTVLDLAEDSAVDLARTVHERVQSSVVHTERVTVPNGSVVRVALRRTPTGELVSQVIGTGDVNLADPATARAIDGAEARVREAAGLA